MGLDCPAVRKAEKPADLPKPEGAPLFFQTADSIRSFYGRVFLPSKPGGQASRYA